MVTKELRRQADPSLSGTISQTLVGSPLAAIEEFICNAYDADATIVKINYDAEKGNLEISDNGSGMGSEGVRAFYRMGDSPKQANRITPKGRKTIGKYGIASVLLRYLSQSYNLATTKNNETRSVQEYFDEKVDDTSSLDVIVTGSELPNGTRIDMQGIKFPDIDINRLKRNIRLHLPLSDDFQIYLNEQEVQPQQEISGEMYAESRYIEGIGQVNFKLTYYRGAYKQEDRGVFIYVNRRQVGNEKDFHFGARKESFYERSMLRVDADGLESSIAFDRSHFQETPEVARLRTEILPFMNQIKSYINPESERRGKSRYNLSEKIGRAYIRREFEKKRFVRGKSATTLRIRYLDLGEEGPLGRLEGDTLVVNNNHLLMPIAVDGDYRDLEAYVDLAFLTTVTCKERQIEDYSNILAKVAHFVSSQRDASDFGEALLAQRQEEDTINPMRLYTIQEVKRLLGLSHVTYELLKAGLGLQKDGTKSLGKDLVSIRQELEGYEFLWEFITGLYKDLTRERQRQIRRSVLDQLSGVNNPDFIKDIGVYAPMYLVEAGSECAFVSTFTPNTKIELSVDVRGVDLYTLEGIIFQLRAGDSREVTKNIAQNLATGHPGEDIASLPLREQLGMLSVDFRKKIEKSARNKLEEYT